MPFTDICYQKVLSKPNIAYFFLSFIYSNASRTSGDVLIEEAGGHKAQIPVYKIAMLGTSSVGKTTLTYQFTTSEYICAYDLSLGKSSIYPVPKM